jgi:perosamine synthetase
MKVSQFEPFIGMEEYEAIKDCFDKKWITEGPKAAEFSQSLCGLIGAKYGVFAPNGTLALYLALKSLGIGPGDEVIVPNFTFIASANSVEMIGATPVFVDINLQTLQIDVQDCYRALTKSTKAIMPVHIYGASADMSRVMAFAKENNLLVIEDAAQALGVKWAGKGCGSFGDAATFSFFADKTLTTGEGGFVTTNNKEIYDRLRLFRNQGRFHRGTFQHPAIGYNFRMTDIQMAIGLAQLKKFDIIVEKKNKILNLYRNLLSDVEDLKIMTPSEEVSPFIPFRVILMGRQLSGNLMEFMKRNDIETRTLFYPLHRQPCFKGRWSTPGDECFKNSIHAYEHGICLPSYPSLEEEKIEYVCHKIRNFYSAI